LQVSVMNVDSRFMSFAIEGGPCHQRAITRPMPPSRNLLRKRTARDLHLKTGVCTHCVPMHTTRPPPKVQHGNHVHPEPGQPRPRCNQRKLCSSPHCCLPTTWPLQLQALGRLQAALQLRIQRWYLSLPLELHLQLLVVAPALPTRSRSARR